MNYPVIIEARCVLSDDRQSAILWLRRGSERSLYLTVIHEGAGIAKYELLGNESIERLVVRHGECIIVLARHNGQIVVYGLFQINLGDYGDIASVLLPLGSDNIEVVQGVEADIEEPAKVEVAA